MKTYKKLLILCLIITATFLVKAGNASAVSLNQTNVNLSVGQSMTVYATNFSNLYVSTNYSPNVATVSISGGSVNIYGVSTGSTTATICDSSTSYNCTSIYITVNSNGYNNGNYYNNNNNLNISNITLSAGSSATISSNNNYNYGGQTLYVSNNTNPSVASTSNGSAIPGCYAGNIYSITTGQLCNNNGNSYYPYNSTSYIPGCYAGDIYSITTGQLCNGNYNNYNYNNNYINSGSIVISAISAGSDTITLCQNGSSNMCSTIYVTVTGYSTPTNYSYNYTPTGYNYNSPSSYDNSGIPIIYSTSTAY